MEGKFKGVEKNFNDVNKRIHKETIRREQSDKDVEDRLSGVIKELNELIEVRYQKKQKTKVDFLIEVKNMHA